MGAPAQLDPRQYALSDRFSGAERSLDYLMSEIRRGPTPPMCKVRRTGSISVPSVTLTAVPWQTILLDDLGMATVGSSAITIPTNWSGYWRIEFSGTWGTSPTTAGTNFIQLQFMQVLLGGVTALATDGPAAQHTASCTRLLTGGDVLTLNVFQQHAGNINFGGSLEEQSSLTLTWIRPSS